MVKLAPTGFRRLRDDLISGVLLFAQDIAARWHLMMLADGRRVTA